MWVLYKTPFLSLKQDRKRTADGELPKPHRPQPTPPFPEPHHPLLKHRPTGSLASNSTTSSSSSYSPLSLPLEPFMCICVCIYILYAHPDPFKTFIHVYLVFRFRDGTGNRRAHTKVLYAPPLPTLQRIRTSQPTPAKPLGHRHPFPAVGRCVTVCRIPMKYSCPLSFIIPSRPIRSSRPWGFIGAHIRNIYIYILYLHEYTSIYICTLCPFPSTRANPYPVTGIPSAKIKWLSLT